MVVPRLRSNDMSQQYALSFWVLRVGWYSSRCSRSLRSLIVWFSRRKQA